MPRVTGLAHVNLSVRDRDASIEFYRVVLGFKEVLTRDGKQWLHTECRHPSGLVLGFTQHRDHFKATFDPRHIGMDHLSLRVASVGELEIWEERLTDLDIDHSPVVHTQQGSTLTFADPDGIQLELFCPADPDTGED
ncbi:VOC family protein [Nocardiopsis sediminis]|uniref:VOC family protein n=1 Tax=Nocardiopsis sediminis TaxID=1778267 RepID=A0ABV8FKU0_9ACTN